MKKKSRDASKCLMIQKQGDTATLILQKPLTLNNATDYGCAVEPTQLPHDVNTIVLDLSAVQIYDSYLIIFIAGLKHFCEKHTITCRLEGMSTDMNRFVEVMEKPLLEEKEPKKEVSAIEKYIAGVGERSLVFFGDARDGIRFLGEVTYASLQLFRHSSSMRWKDFPFFFGRGGVNALPVVLLINFLVGVVTGYQGAVQLHKFGADIFLADLITISLTRELAPLMTAIIVAGRSGSSYAAEIGTMKVSEEVDALEAMGFNITKFLILPRVFATTLALPLLTIFADVFGIIGGLVAASFILEISLTGFMIDAQQALRYSDIYTGIFKSVLFGLIIGMVGCFRGLQVKGGAESVGKYTTTAVVTSIFLIILVDAIFTIVFQLIGI